MNRLIAAAREFQEFLQNQKWKFCFIGGIAVQRWGEPRFTQDCDVTLLTGFGGEERFIDAILTAYSPRIETARAMALRSRVLLVKNSTGVEFDVALGGLPYEQEMIARSSEEAFLAGVFLRTCSAEDLIVMKAFAARPKDWMDVEGVFQRQGEKLDVRAIEERLKPLSELKKAPEIMDRLRSFFPLASPVKKRKTISHSEPGTSAPQPLLGEKKKTATRARKKA